MIRESFQDVARDFGLTVENCPSNGAFIKDEKLREMWDRGESRMYGLFEDGAMAGFAALDPDGEGRLEICKLSVLPCARHGGHGKKLIDHLRAEAARLGAHTVTIGIIDENTRLKAWYMDYGFILDEVCQFPGHPFTVGLLHISAE